MFRAHYNPVLTVELISTADGALSRPVSQLSSVRDPNKSEPINCKNISGRNMFTRSGGRSSALFTVNWDITRDILIRTEHSLQRRELEVTAKKQNLFG